MRFLVVLWTVSSLLSSWVSAQATSNITVPLQNQKDPNAPRIVWSSLGGGWRSMANLMGFARVFSEAGLFDETSSRFASISTNSAASWFNTQFFYSQIYYDLCTKGTIAEIDLFIEKWMDSYKRLFDYKDGKPDDKKCRFLPFLLTKGVSLAHLFDCMLREAARDYGDETFGDIVANAENRIPPLQDTSMYLQCSLSPTSRITKPLFDTLTYVGPQSGNGIYTLNLAAQFAVETERGQYFQYAVEPSDEPFRLYVTHPPFGFRLKDWKIFNLFPPPEDATVVSDGVPKHDKQMEVRLPWNGQATTIQSSIASSLVTGFFAGSMPSLLAQSVSINAFEAGFFGKFLQIAQGKTLYALEDHPAELALCSQWPDDCGPNDLQFTDGGASDGGSLATTIGHDHRSGRNLNVPLKLIQTQTYFTTDRKTKFITYFRNPFNTDIAPGDFIWAPNSVKGGDFQPNPWRSHQIFDMYMDDASLDALEGDFLPGTNVTVARLSLTTVANPAYGVLGGYPVDMLLLSYTGSVPTTIIGPKQIEQFNRLTQLSATELVGSAELLDAVNDYLDD